MQLNSTGNLPEAAAACKRISEIANAPDLC